MIGAVLTMTTLKSRRRKTIPTILLIGVVLMEMTLRSPKKNLMIPKTPMLTVALFRMTKITISGASLIVTTPKFPETKILMIGAVLTMTTLKSRRRITIPTILLIGVVLMEMTLRSPKKNLMTPKTPMLTVAVLTMTTLKSRRRKTIPTKLMIVVSLLVLWADCCNFNFVGT